MSGARQRERRSPGAGRWIALGGVVAVAVGSAFGAGVYVGRHWARPGPPADGEAVKKVAAPRRSGLVEPIAERARDSREPLTFYQTLTAPLAPLPAPARVAAPGKGPGGGLPGPRPAAEPRAAAPAPQVGPSMSAAASEWTVQVGVFRDRRQADGLRRQLAEGGVEAHIADARGDDGQLRHRVRVGSFKTRDEAARVAARMASERRVATYVTLR